MNRTRNSLILGGLVVITLALWFAWFFKHFDYVEKERRSGLSKAARKNPFHAAELYLRQAGLEVESSSGRDLLINLPSTGDVLVVNDIGTSLNAQRQAALMAWIEDGGRLITAANRFWNKDTEQSGNRLLDDLKIRLVEHNPFEKSDNKDAEETADTDKDTSKKNKDRRSKDPLGKIAANAIAGFTNKPVTITLENDEEVDVLFDNNRSLLDVEFIASYSAGTEDRTHMLDIPIGDGWVTVFSDSQFLKHRASLSFISALDIQSNTIEEHDNAYLLWNLVEGADKVWLLYSIDALPFTGLVWSRAQLACISFFALVLFWLWWQRNRFGPLKGQLDPPRRNLLEHIRMAAAFSWRQDKGRLLLSNNREHIKHQLCAKHPAVSKLPPEEQCQRLAELLESGHGLSAQQIHQALYADWRNERDFIQISYLLQIVGGQL